MVKKIMISLIKIYYVRGLIPKSSFRYAIKSPPTCGYQLALLIDISQKNRRIILCPYTLETFNVPENCAEIQLSEPSDIPFERIVKQIKNKWKELHASGEQRQFDIIANALKQLGSEVPDLSYIVKRVRKNVVKKDSSPKGKPMGDSFRSIKSPSIRANIALEFRKRTSIHAAMAKFNMTRSNVLSHLFCIQKYHGFGYTLYEDNTAQLILPKDFLLVEEK